MSVQDAIKTARGAVREAVHANGTEDVLETLRNAKCLLALRELAAVREPGMSDKDFLAALVKVGFETKSAKLIQAGLADRQTFLKSLWVALAWLPGHAIETQPLNAVLENFNASSACREALEHATHAPLTPNDIGLNKRDFAPFVVRVFEANLFPELIASDLAHVHVYVRSGHAAADLMDPQQPIAKLYQLLRDGEDVEATVISGLVSLRLAELMAPVWVGVLLEPPSGGGPYPVAWSKEAGTSAPEIEFCGLIEALIRGHGDKTTWHMANSSSRPSRDDDFLSKSVAAVENSIDIGFPPFKPGDAIGTLIYVAPAMH